MSSTAIATMKKMMESLPEAAQEQAVEQLRDFIAEMQEESEWDALFEKTQDQLIVAARKARAEIASGKSEPMDYEQL
ncbi:hypothetical protein [Candidatus Leptofilum sp.]|uniref:hypothetical protein n=1 Tax=Candidatus Leptofilum sp. TaxID=3241576 RepID=UPI003B5B1673